MSDERRRADRLPVDLGGVLFLAGGRSVDVRIRNMGAMGALVQILDLEVSVLEGDRVVLEHPTFAPDASPDDFAAAQRIRSAGAVVRVELDFEVEGVKRELAVYFDGGAEPEGYER